MKGKLGGPIFLPKYAQNTTRLCYFIAEVSISADNRGGVQRITTILRVLHGEIRGAGKPKRKYSGGLLASTQKTEFYGF